MSITIYNGFRFRTHSIHAVHALIMQFRTRLETLANAKSAKWLAETATELIDRRTAKGEPIGHPLVDAHQEQIERQKKIEASGLRDPDVDYQFQVAVIPHRDSFLGITYTEQEDWRRLWNRHQLVEEYSYFNNTDKPKNISEYRWKQRRNDWEQAVGNDPVNLRSFSADCVNRYRIHPATTAIVRRIPAFERRVIEMARERVADVWIRDKTQADQKDFRTNSFAYILDAYRWMETNDGKAVLETEKNILRSKLIPKITKDVLLGEVTSAPEATPSPASEAPASQ